MGYLDPTSFSQGIDGVDERRAYPRVQVALQGICSIAGGADETCTILDLSLGGAKVASTGKAVAGAKISLLLPHVGLLDARVAWRVAWIDVLAEDYGRARDGLVGSKPAEVGWCPTRIRSTGGRLAGRRE